MSKNREVDMLARLTIGKLAKEAGVNPKTIRYYEEIGLLPRARRNDAGYRTYIGAGLDGVPAMPNQSGIAVQGADHNFVQANLVANNRDTGITIQSGEENLVHHNRIMNNGKNGYDQGKNNRWDNGIQGNYWSDYKGQDADGDGIGDTPYAVLPNGVDKRPLMKP